MNFNFIEQHQAQIDDLQQRLAYQEDMLQSLNDRVAHQDKVIMQLQQQLQAHHKRVDDLVFSLESKGIEKPPHY